MYGKGGEGQIHLFPSPTIPSPGQPDKPFEPAVRWEAGRASP
ncbi:MAG: hypothetical protein OZSIB_1503 [Candidatus Ozemobacter sibiricus]|uniref:Uncharacterized protein n=1 Tax=Candidatus Ozemobacter sibiricus TaxID=2268124 RepID=A0A367ZM05_9BACT|nr:MAG: hypothetical protein OZSIB_1503 [Candidatus Ozemobacter sibiricus]